MEAHKKTNQLVFHARLRAALTTWPPLQPNGWCSTQRQPATAPALQLQELGEALVQRAELEAARYQRHELACALAFRELPADCLVFLLELTAELAPSDRI